MFSSMKDNLTWKVNADLSYSPPCEGCLNCLVSKENELNKKWYQRLV